MSQYVIYNHGGSANHGCEALVRTVLGLMGPVQAVYSEAPEQDCRYGIQKLTTVLPAKQPYSKRSWRFWNAYLHLKWKGDYIPMDTLPYWEAIRRMPEHAVELSIGGDIYCYEDYLKFVRLHEAISKKHKSILVGCSLEPELFQDPRFREDIGRYDAITARESLTYQALRDAGVPNVFYLPDSAFTLAQERRPFPDGFDTSNVVGINISPLVLRKEGQKGIVRENFVRLIGYILDQTEYTVAFIPHVVWPDNDDREALRAIRDAVGDSERVTLLEDCNCMQLKGYISRCRFFIGARTHATIAAYSTCVPTLVLGYSIKSRGIAEDLFGTHEHYVVPVQQLERPEEMTVAFQWLQEHEDEIRAKLTAQMPEYIGRAHTLRGTIEGILG